MSASPRAIESEENLRIGESNTTSKNMKVGGRNYSCSCDSRRLTGLTTLIAAAVMLIFALILASGVFGGGTLGFVAGALTVGSMIFFGISAYLLVPKTPKIQPFDDLSSAKSASETAIEIH